ncbi:hypothetical protein WA026_006859 [Henosepilachna vigintioctopunctata]|uniref:Uncharacterized protein n=1 Tax=Henosepilachna vigintioctopunctata TaxID=420089 RepID=A0AAW1UA47_9CUCU
MIEKSEQIDINNICRSCMGTNAKMQNVFENKEYFKNNKMQLADMLMACASVQVTSEDGLPHLMCSSCEGKLITAYDFKQLSEKSDVLLRDFLKSVPQVENVKQEDIVIQPDLANDISNVDAHDAVDNEDDVDIDIDMGNPDYSDSDFEEPEPKKTKKSKNKHICTYCDKVLRTKKGLKIHERKHINDKAKSSKKEPKEGRKTRSSKDYCEDVKEEVKSEDICVDNLLETEIKDEQDLGVEGENDQGRKESLDCQFCPKKLTTPAGLKIHMRKHTGTDLSVCEICNKSFTKASHLKRHQQTHGLAEVPATGTTKEKKLLQCEFCDRTFKYRKSFNHHMQTEHGVDGDDSDVCLSTIAEKAKKEKEEKQNRSTDADTVETDDDSKFDKDDELFPSPSDKKRPTKVHTCHVCQTEFTRANHLTRHMILHRAVLIHKCTQCDNAYATEEHLKKHVEEGHVNKPYACTMCNKQFSRGEHLIRHLKTHQNLNGEEDLKCAICEKTFTRSDHLARHTKVHLLQDKRHVCSDCGKAFNRLDNLKTHQRIHTGIKDPTKLHLCIYCGKEFNNSSNMIVHMRRHTGERPYKCAQCGKGFPRSHDLKCHERTHSGEKPYLCTLCGKSFNKSNKLLRHTRVHTGERPYVCSICGRAFTQSNDLALHMRRHTGARPYGCGMCPARFIQSGQLKAHRRSTGHWVETPPDLKGGHRVEPVTPILDPVPVRFRSKPKLDDVKPVSQMINPPTQPDMVNNYQMVPVPGPPKLIGLGLTAEQLAAMAPRSVDQDHNSMPADLKLKIESTEKENQTMAETSFHHDAYALQKSYFPNYM